MEKRMYGTNPMAECRRDSHETVNKNKRYSQIKRELMTCPQKGLTAKEIAVRLWRRHLIPEPERNYTAPRLTELCEQGVVEPIGKRLCSYSGKKVTVYALREA